MIKVWIVDDHQMFIDGIKALLKDVDGIEITGQAMTGQEVLDLLDREQPPEIILMDLSMPVMDGQKATLRVKERFPDVKIIMLTMHIKPEIVTSILDSGADGYVLKNTGKDELITALRQVSKGDHYYSNEVADALIQNYRLNEKRQKEVMQPIELTEREKEVLKLIIDEFTTSEIASRLHLSTHTIETYRKNLLSKVNARNTAGLVKWAVRNNLD